MKRLKAKKALCVALAMSLTMPILPVNAVSSDINGHWAKKTISQWEEKGLISGYKDGTFKPNKEVTRAEFVHILNLALKLTKQGEVKFADVKQGDWFYKDIEIAVGEGYAKGTPENKFMPNATLTRAEAAVFITNILKEKSDKQLSFKDVDMIPSWAKQAIALMVEKGYMTGYPDNTFSARKNLTRAEAVTILDKVISQVQVSKKEEKKEEKKQVPVAVEEQKAVQAKKSSGGGGGGGGGGGSSTPSIPNALGAKTVKNAQELEAAVSSGYNKITVDATEKIERDVNLSYSPKQELEITINKAQDKVNNIKITAPNTTKITLKDDGVQDNGTVLDNLTIDAPNAHVESSFAVDTVEIVRVASSTFKALDKVTTIKVQNEAKIEIGKDVVVKPNVEIQTDKEVKLVGKYNKVTTTKDSEIRLEEGTKIEEYTTSMAASQSMITGGEIEKITAQSNLTIKDTKVKDIEIPSTTNKKLTMNVQGNAVVKKIVNNSAYNLKLNTEKVGQVEDTRHAKLEKNQVVSVSISGTPKAGQTLTAITSPSNADVTYKWMVSETENGNYSAIGNATDKEYTVANDKAGKFIKVEVTGTGNYEGTVLSSFVKIEDVANVNKVEIKGKNEVGEVLTAEVTPSNATVTYQWKKASSSNGNYEDVVGATEKTYRVKKGDKFLKVEVKNQYNDINKLTSDEFAINERDNQLDAVLSPAVNNFNTNIKVTTEPILSGKISFKYGISDGALTYNKDENIDNAKVATFKNLDKDIVTHLAGEDLELDENIIDEVVKGNSKYLTVYQLNNVSTTTPNQLVAYASMKLTKEVIRLPEKKEWNIQTTHTIKGDKIFVKGRFETVGNIKAAMQIKSNGQDVKSNFDINVKSQQSGTVIQDLDYLSDSYIIEIAPKVTRENKYIYGEGKTFKVRFTDDIKNVKFKEGTAVQVGDTLTAQVFISIPNPGDYSLEETGNEDKYENLTYKWYTEENGVEKQVAGEIKRTYTVKQEDVGKSIKVEVAGDGVEVASAPRKSGGTLNVTGKKWDISFDGKAYETDTSKIKIKILDDTQAAIDDNKVKVEAFIGNNWVSIKGNFQEISAVDREYEVQLKDVDKIPGNRIRLTITGTRYDNADMYIHRSLEGLEFKTSSLGGVKAKIEGSKLVIKDSNVTIKDLLEKVGEVLELKISGVRPEFYDISGKLITVDKANEHFENGMKLKVSSEISYPNAQPKEYTIEVQ